MTRSPDERLRAALQRAVEAMGEARTLDAAYRDVAARLAAEPDFARPATRAGIARTLDHYLSAEVHEAAPDWRWVRLLHRSWVAANAYDDAGRGKVDGGGKKFSPPA